jgi:tRNA-5-methyluridine54 2-sulfurtransferase
VLVLHDGELVTADRDLPDDAEVEVRPVISGGAGAAPRCVCAVPRPSSRNRGTVRPGAPSTSSTTSSAGPQGDRPPARRERGERMFSYGDRLLVAVSGGKDSLALWDVLLDARLPRRRALRRPRDRRLLVAQPGQVCERFAAERGARLHVVDLAERYGYTTPSGASATGRSTCGVCGLSKRYVFNQVAVEHGYDVMLTGHNLDDEAATLLGNVLRWQDDFLARQRPVLPTTGGNQVRKCKPLYRLSERETAAYCVVRGIDYVVEECPLVDGNTGQELKAALDPSRRRARDQGPVPVRVPRPARGRFETTSTGRARARCLRAACRPR